MKYVFVFFSFLVVLSLSAQNFMTVPHAFSTQRDSLFMADIYSGKSSLEDIIEISTSDRLWTVYSDKHGVIVYSRCGGNENGQELEFMQPLRVVSIDGKCIQVAGFDSEIIVGWVNVEDLLLSSFSITTKHTLKEGEGGKASIPKKAVILSGELERNSQGDFKVDKHYYNIPKELDDNILGDPKVFQPLFVYKEYNGFVLLGVTDYLDGAPKNNVSKVLGWLPRRNAVFWNTRLALEPTNTQEAIIEYEGLNIGGYSDLRNLKACLDQQICLEDKIVADVKIGPIRNSQMRKPVIKHIDDNIKKVVSIAREQHDNNDLYREMVEDATALMSKTNIIFVVDATSSMSPYFKAIANSLQLVIDRNSKVLASELKFGLIVYRDYPDGVDAYEVTPLTADVSAMKSKLNSVICKSNDNDLPEALFNGLKKGVESLNLSPKESNVVVLIGDCGNHMDDAISIDEVSQLLFEKAVNLISFQVRSGKDNSYINFNTDIKDIIETVSRKKIHNKDVSLDISFEKHDNILNIKMSGGDDDDLVNMFGLLQFARSAPSQPKDLEELINTSLSKYFATLSDNINIINRWIYTGVSSEDPPEGLILKLTELYDLSKEDVKRLLKNTEVTTEAFIALKYFGKSEYAQTPVILLTNHEKKRLVKTLRMLSIEGLSYSERKFKFQQSLMEVCLSIVGQNTSQDLINSLTLNQIWNMIMGVDFGIEELQDVRLNEVASISSSTFNSFFDTYQIKANSFCNESYYSTDPMRSRRFKIANSYLYWIPLEDLPGCALEY